MGLLDIITSPFAQHGRRFRKARSKCSTRKLAKNKCKFYIKPWIDRITHLSVSLVLGAAFTSTWTGVHVAGLKLTDYFLLGGAVCVMITVISDGRRLPIYAWALIPPASLLLITLTRSLLIGEPLTSPSSALKMYIVGDAPAFKELGGALPLVARLALALTAVTFILTGVSESARDGRVLISRIMRIWAAGAATNAAYSVIAHTSKISALANLSFLTHLSSPRASGLANHPNSLGQAIVTALPMLIYVAATAHGFAKLVWALAVPLSFYAIYLSGSRAALLFGVVFASATFVYLVASGTRPKTWVLPAVMFVLPLAIIAAPTLLRNSRFFDSTGKKSDLGRVANLQRGLELFNSNPLFGTGAGSWMDEMVPLIVLTSGGLLYFVIFYGSLSHPLRVRPHSSDNKFVVILVISCACVLVCGLLSNYIGERYLYWPFAALFALSLHQNSIVQPSNSAPPTVAT